MPRARPVVTYDCCYKRGPFEFSECHRLVPWFFTFCARSLAINVNNHGTSPWHLPKSTALSCSCDRKDHGASPWHKPKQAAFFLGFLVWKPAVVLESASIERKVYLLPACCGSTSVIKFFTGRESRSFGRPNRTQP